MTQSALQADPVSAAAEGRSEVEFETFVRERIAGRAGATDSRQCLDERMVHELGRRGYLGSLVPDHQFGAKSVDLQTYGARLEEVGAACAAVLSLFTAHDMVARTVATWGSMEQREKWLRAMCDGGAIAAFALSEASAGSNAEQITTAAVRTSGGNYLLNGDKKWITVGQIASVLLVFARTGDSISAFLVERARPGVTVSPITGMLGFRGSMLADVSLRGCEVPSSALVGGLGRGYPYILTSALTYGRYSVACGAVGIARACLYASFDYVRRREQFGKPIGEHQLIQHKLAAMATDVCAARLLCREAGAMLQRDDPAAMVQVCMAKYFASQAAFRCATHAVQIHGANGCSDRYPVERHLRDAKILEIIEGSTEIQELILARYGQA
jgi:glutaryl-CoA dehydrogenase (non-decarboxylating)